MSSLALLEAEIPSPLYVTGKINVDLFLVLMVAIVVSCLWNFYQMGPLGRLCLLSILKVW